MRIFDSSIDPGNFINELMKGNPIAIGLAVVGGLIVLLAIFAAIISIYLAVRYIKYNHTQNSIQKTGQDVARQILDDNGLEKIRVKCVGSILFGNSYSHYFKKVRLRRLTWKKKSISSLAMAAQKSSLAILDKEKDPSMKARIILTPIVSFGPFAFIPLLIVGVILDILLFNFTGVTTLICAGIGVALFLASFIIQFVELKTEKKAQEKALVILSENNMATEEELEMIKKLFRLYNIEYINNIILSILEIIFRILYILFNATSSGSSTSSSSN